MYDSVIKRNRTHYFTNKERAIIAMLVLIFYSMWKSLKKEIWKVDKFSILLHYIWSWFRLSLYFTSRWSYTIFLKYLRKANIGQYSKRKKIRKIKNLEIRGTIRKIVKVISSPQRKATCLWQFHIRSSFIPTFTCLYTDKQCFMKFFTNPLGANLGKMHQ